MSALGVIVAVGCVLFVLAVVGPHYAYAVIDDLMATFDRRRAVGRILETENVAVVPPPPAVVAMRLRSGEARQEAFDLQLAEIRALSEPTVARSRWS